MEVKAPRVDGDLIGLFIYLKRHRYMCIYNYILPAISVDLDVILRADDSYKSDNGYKGNTRAV